MTVLDATIIGTKGGTFDEKFAFVLVRIPFPVLNGATQCK